MQYLGDDMKEIFQQAAEGYHLDPGKNAWESISGRIHEQRENALVVRKKQPIIRSYRFAMALMLLAIIGMLYPKLCMGPVVSRSILNHTEKKPHIAFANKNKKNIIPVVANVNNSDFSHSKVNNNLLYVLPNKTGAGFLNAHADALSIPNKQSQKTENLQLLDTGNENISTGDIIFEKEITINTRKEHLLQEPELTTIHKPEEKDQIKLITKTASAPKTSIAKGWYAGAFTITDASNVKSMPCKKIGFGGGVLLGYNINNKLSIEGSFALEQKKYDTDGKDFSVDKIRSTMPPGMIINQLRSTTSIASLSLNVRYRFIQHKRSSAYVSSGLSAYNVTKESNTYTVSLNGITQNMQGLYTANNAKLPAIVGLGAGYEYKLDKKTALRVEPYLQIPIQGIGVGSVPVTSAGLHVSIIRSLK